MVILKKPTLVIGASLNESRYSNKVIKKLVDLKFRVFAIGKKTGEAHGIKIHKTISSTIKIDTVSIYINSSLQNLYIDFIIKLSPNRVIFNPGTENTEIFKLLSSKDIYCENSCSLVLLSTNQY